MPDDDDLILLSSSSSSSDDDSSDEEALSRDLQAMFTTLDTESPVLAPTPQNKGFIEKYGARPWRAAGADVAKGIAEISAGAASIRGGDTLGGTSAILKGIGSISGFMALAGPLGAIAAGVMSVITAIVAAVLDALKPAAESLEQKIERLLISQDLRNARHALVAARSAGNVTLAEIDALAGVRKRASEGLAGAGADDPRLDTLREQAEGTPWTELKAFGWVDQFKTIGASFATLSDSKGYGSKEWLGVYDLTIQCATEFWMQFEALAGLVRAIEMPAYQAARRVLAAELQVNIAASHFASLNEGDFYSTWINGNHFGWSMYKGDLHNHLYRVQGVFGAGGGANQADLGGQVAAFAHASSGTLFTVGYVSDDHLFAGRGNDQGWRIARGAPRCEQVVIGEMADDMIKVVALQDHGKTILVCDFNDEQGTSAGFEQSPEAWTPHDKRWEKMVPYAIPDQWTMLSVAIDPLSLRKNAPLVLYGFGLVEYGGGNCCRLQVDEKTGKVSVQAIDETWLTPDQIRAATGGVLPPQDGTGKVVPSRLANVSPATVTCARKVILAQVGDTAWVYEREGDRTWRSWDVRKVFWNQDWGAADLQCYQARAFEDEAMVCQTNRGVVLRYWDERQRALILARNDKIQSPWFSRDVARQGGVALELSAILREAAAPAKPVLIAASVREGASFEDLMAV